MQISASHYIVREEEPKVFKQIALIYPITLLELPNDRSYGIAGWSPVPISDLRRCKESQTASIHLLCSKWKSLGQFVIEYPYRFD